MLTACIRSSQVGQTQSQALQTIQDQQGQILTALLPILPLLQVVPLHIETSRKNVEDAVSESKSDVKARITDLEDRVKSSFEVLGNQIRGSLSQDHVKNGASALRSHFQDSVSDLRPISTPVAAASPTDRLARGTSRSRSRSQKRPRSGSPGDTGSSDPATSPSDSKKRRLDNQSGRAALFPAHSSHLVSGTASRRIHTPTVPTTASSSSSHASPDILLPAAYMRSADQLVRTPLADLDPRTPNAPPNPGTPASIVSSAPKHLRGSRYTLHAHPTMPAGPPTRAFSTQSYSAQAQTLALDAPSGYTMPTSSPTSAAPITPGSFRLPLPALRLSRTTTATPRSHTTLNGSTSSSRYPAFGEKPRISGAPIQGQASRTCTLTRGLSAFREVAVQDAYHGTSTHAFGVGLPLGVGVGGGTPRTPRLPVDASMGTSVAPPPPSSVGKPMRLKDRRAMLAEDRLQRDEGKRFIPLDDEEDEDVETAG
ncbi:hypothetical protein LXA43DRAFT_666974 [Ganoderma leucocontextum]|nr:hypothetical protein LXA43DRAFT_666974 [Ganoderma leucocontextum]